MCNVAIGSSQGGSKVSVGKLNTRLVEKKHLANGFWWFELEFKEVFDFEAGQYLSVKMNEKGEMRAYSIASVPGSKKIGLLVDVSPGGLGSKFFLMAEVGDEIEVLGPLGRFVADPSCFEALEGLVFVATGSGIAPVKSILEDLLKNKKYKGRVRLVWGLRFENDIFWQKDFEKMEEKYKNFKLNLVLSKPSKNWEGRKGRVTDLLEKMEKLGSRHIYLCGGNEMVDGCRKSLSEKGVKDKNIYFEKYG